MKLINSSELEERLKTYFRIAKENRRGLSKQIIVNELFLLDAICQDFKLDLSKEIREYIETLI